MYITDTLKAIADNTGKALKQGGVGMQKRFVDLINDSPDDPDVDEEEKAQEVKERIKGILEKIGKEGG